MYFPAVHDVRSVLLARIRAETVRIDVAAWYLTEHAISLALAERFSQGVQVRVIGDRVAIFESDPLTRREFYWLASQGIPIRLRYEPLDRPEPAHWKAMIFAAQGMVTFGSANYTPFELAPISATNYKDETVLFTDDPALANAFRTRFDRMWNDTTAEPGSIVAAPPYLKNWDDACLLEPVCTDYRVLYPQPRVMAINLARLEPDHPSPPELVWGQGPEFNQRLVAEIARETVRVDLVTYRLTTSDITDALIAKARQGVPVRVIIEPEQYTSRVWPEYWLTHANIDRLWAAGIPIRQRAHQGLTHMKMLVTSNVATNASSNFSTNWQRDHNLFVAAATKPSVHLAMRQRFETMWTDTIGFAPFTPGPPDAPVLRSPVGEAAPLLRDAPLTWARTPFATSYDVYLGTSPSNLVYVASVPAQLTLDPPATYTWTPPYLQSRTRYYWQVPARTLVNQTTSSAVTSFVTALWQRSGDFNGDGQSDMTVFRPETGTWYFRNAGPLGGASNFAWGVAGDVPVAADYDGDGKSDVAVYRPAAGAWMLLLSNSGRMVGVHWGLPTDRPVPADYDGDRLADIAVYRPSNGTWYLLLSSTGAARAITWGDPADMPIPGDYDGDGRADIAVYRPSEARWYIWGSLDGLTSYVTWGAPNDVPVPADYDGDGRTDIAVFRPNGEWHIRRSSQPPTAVTWGLSTDVPVPADYDGDSRDDVAVYRPSEGRWYVWSSLTGTGSFVQWGLSSDVPVLQAP